MKKVAVLLLTGATMVATSANAGLFNKDVKEVTEDGIHAFKAFKPAAVRAEIGTQGYGGALVYSASPSVDVEAGFASADEVKLFSVDLDKLSKDIDSKDVNGKIDLKYDPNKNAYLNAKIRPFKNNFHVTTGILWQDNKMVASAKNLNGKVTVNDKEFNGNYGDININYDFKNEVAPYLGIGFSPSITKRWGLFGEVGAAYIGDSNVTVTSSLPDSTPVNSNLTPQQAAQQKLTVGDFRREIEEKIDENNITSKVLPVAKVGVTFRF